ncbi:hypothetical protein [Streptomyces yaizuensis]|uniref:Uncharacterized protein n=1 Tax=Streptomyces yaizuensis TaxID=2989713 RepID=A0ABQ5NRZ1_9ACTN|nr:hypothetical protein [Streptomyces sp. YSPA8]GLF92930.1 hypothetical protein SYYSPA8_01555 [Streptomyces sp. YSPA8]
MSQSPTPGPLWPQATAQPWTQSRLLPPYRALLAVDAKDFTGHPSAEHGVISRAVVQLLETSLRRAGLGEIWEDRRFPASTGDGYVFGFDPAFLPFVVHPWLHTLQDVLTEFRVHSLGAAPIRLRVSLHVGPLPDSGDDFDGNGTPRNDTHRLLDSRPVKAVLAASGENVTHVAAILSDRCFQDAVAGGWTGRHPDHFIEVPATVEGKSFEQRAWLYVPAPSGRLYDRRVLGDRVIDDHEGTAPAGAGAQEAARAAGPTVVNRADRGNVNTGTVHGGQHVSNSRTDSRTDVGGDWIGGDRVGGNKAGTVHGNQGDTVHGNKREERHR